MSLSFAYMQKIYLHADEAFYSSAKCVQNLKDDGQLSLLEQHLLSWFTICTWFVADLFCSLFTFAFLLLLIARKNMDDPVLG